MKKHDQLVEKMHKITGIKFENQEITFEKGYEIYIEYPLYWDLANRWMTQLDGDKSEIELVVEELTDRLKLESQYDRGLLFGWLILAKQKNIYPNDIENGLLIFENGD